MPVDIKHDEPRSEIYLRALELAAQMGNALLKEGRSGKDFWRRVPESACELTSMEMASVVVLEDEGRTIRFVADAGVDPPMAGRAFPLAYLPVGLLLLAAAAVAVR